MAEQSKISDSTLTREELIARATYWDARAPEVLHHETLAEALEYYIDYCSIKGESTSACIARVCPVTVAAYARNEWTLARQEAFAGNMLDRLIEDVDQDEEIGAGEDGIDLTDEQYSACMAKALELVSELAEHHQPYWCTEIGVVTFEAGEVERILRNHVPSWFDSNE